MNRSVLWALAVLLLAPALALIGAAPIPDSPRCTVERRATPEPITGLYTVTLTARDCAPGGIARVRLQSGRIYPWRTVPAGQRTVYTGVPFYWIGAWEARSGRVYTFEIPGMTAPWGR